MSSLNAGIHSLDKNRSVSVVFLHDEWYHHLKRCLLCSYSWAIDLMLNSEVIVEVFPC